MSPTIESALKDIQQYIVNYQMHPVVSVAIGHFVVAPIIDFTGMKYFLVANNEANLIVCQQAHLNPMAYAERPVHD